MSCEPTAWPVKRSGVTPAGLPSMKIRAPCGRESVRISPAAAASGFDCGAGPAGLAAGFAAGAGAAGGFAVDDGLGFSVASIVRDTEEVDSVTEWFATS